jgi:hypothetical protein
MLSQKLEQPIISTPVRQSLLLVLYSCFTLLFVIPGSDQRMLIRITLSGSLQ